MEADFRAETDAREKLEHERRSAGRKAIKKGFKLFSRYEQGDVT